MTVNNNSIAKRTRTMQSIRQLWSWPQLEAMWIDLEMRITQEQIDISSNRITLKNLRGIYSVLFRGWLIFYLEMIRIVAFERTQSTTTDWIYNGINVWFFCLILTPNSIEILIFVQHIKTKYSSDRVIKNKQSNNFAEGWHDFFSLTNTHIW